MEYFKIKDASYINAALQEFVDKKVTGLRLNISKELNNRLPQALVNLAEGPIRKYIYTKVKRRPRQIWDNKHTPHLGESVMTNHRILNQYASEYSFWFDAPHASTHIGKLGSFAIIPAKHKAFMKFKNRDDLGAGWKSAKIVYVPRRVSEDYLYNMMDTWLKKETDMVVSAAAPKGM